MRQTRGLAERNKNTSKPRSSDALHELVITPGRDVMKTVDVEDGTDRPHLLVSAR